MTKQGNQPEGAGRLETIGNSRSIGTGHSGKLQTARILSLANLALLFLQFLLGMWANLFVVFPKASPAVNPLDSVFLNGPYILLAHIVNGLAIGIISITVAVLSVLARNKQMIALASAGLGSVLLAGESGIFFALGWYSNDTLSFSMSVGFAFSLAVYFAILSIPRSMTK